MEYKIKAFSVDYGMQSIGWEREGDRPVNAAGTWINKEAKNGWILDQFIVYAPAYVVVILRMHPPMY